jgi:hypothetical protein
VCGGASTTYADFGFETFDCVKKLIYSVITPAASLFVAVSSLADEPKGPEQPIPYSHKQHLALGLVWVAAAWCGRFGVRTLVLHLRWNHRRVGRLLPNINYHHGG